MIRDNKEEVIGLEPFLNPLRKQVHLLVEERQPLSSPVYMAKKVCDVEVNHQQLPLILQGLE